MCYKWNAHLTLFLEIAAQLIMVRYLQIDLDNKKRLFGNYSWLLETKEYPR